MLLFAVHYLYTPMLNIQTVFFILIIHWVADYLLQNAWMAENKSKHWKPLLVHTSVYTVVTTVLWLAVAIIPPQWKQVVALATSTFILHTATDYITSRISNRLWKQGKTRAFFNVLGLDQLLHFGQLFGTLWIINN